MEDQMKKKKNSRKRKRLKRKLASMTAMVLVLMLGILGTMAYLSTVSNEKHNTFTGSKGISLKLTEPGWDANDNGNADDGDGMKEAGNYTPGKTITKDPKLTNDTGTTGGDSTATEWVAIAVSYWIGNNASTISYKPVSYEAMKYLIEDIVFYNSAAATAASDSSGGYWIPIYVTTQASDGAIDKNNITLTDNSRTNSQAFAIYLYNNTLANGASTHTLFDEIEIRDTTDLEATMNGLSALTTYVGGTTGGFITNAYAVNGNLPGFKIDVIGAAVQNEYDDKDNSGTLATSVSQLSDDNKSQLIKDLVEVIGPKINADVRKVGGTTP